VPNWQSTQHTEHRESGESERFPVRHEPPDVRESGYLPPVLSVDLMALLYARKQHDFVNSLGAYKTTRAAEKAKPKPEAEKPSPTIGGNSSSVREPTRRMPYRVLNKFVG
jgi:hypothetical protein